jgi:FMN phosphatase YigB (HAD superfamily)
MKYVALDIGNVLVNVDFQGFLRKLSKRLNITLEEALYFMNRSQKLHDLGLTVMKDELIDHLKIRSEVLREELIDDWNNCITPADWMLEKLDTWCTEHDLQVALLSNVGLEHAVRMSQVLNHNGFFDKAVKHFSCHVGARKPTVLYYQSFLALHSEWKGCPYIDDLQENLDASQQFGFRTYRFALDEISGKNYIEEAFNYKIGELEKFILADP